ncbi:NAD+ kinase [Mesonia hippocampi]|uniref:NAD kinase n=1 Tax=Mesonia hippocampi TaxID=1628250 RepID=A0A840ETI9_9FLAO|nr:NAD+ kinase [Mesonia hippocampi]
MKVAIYGQFYHENSEVYLQELFQLLKEYNIDTYVEKNFFTSIQNNHKLRLPDYNYPTFIKLDNSFDLFFGIGGDGTILKSVSYVKDLNIPIVGINTGRLGFLASIHKKEIKAAIQAIINKEYNISQRSLLSVATSPQNKRLSNIGFALNEIAISRKNTTSMITVETWLNDNYLSAYWADGLIISTPTGSTGYSLSCGGPIIEPATNAFAITPIAPHNLNARPLIIPDNTEIKLKVISREDKFLASLDAKTTSLNTNTTISIKKANFTIGLVLLHEDSFIKTLRKKLLWGEDKRNKQ